MNFNIDENFYELSCIELSRWYYYEKRNNKEDVDEYFDRLFRVLNWIIKKYGILTKPYYRNIYSKRYLSHKSYSYKYMTYTYEYKWLPTFKHSACIHM
jgi:hypothetical protein